MAELLPNNETIEAMKAARRGELVTVGSTDDLLRNLNANDNNLRSPRRKRRPKATKC